MQPLNIQDQVMVFLHDSLRRRGYAGLLLQAHVYLAGRLDEATLRTALAQLARCYPIVGARLAPGTWRTPSRWEWGDDSACVPTVTDLPSDDDEAVRRHAEMLFATPLDLRNSPPVQFHLLRRPGGRDVVLLQWAHALADGMGGELLLKEINRLHADPTAAAQVVPPGDLLRQHLGRHSWSQRIRAWLRVVRDLPLIGFPTRLVQPAASKARGTVPRIALWRLDRDQTERALGRVRRLCGFANVMPVVVAAAYRAVSRVAPRPLGRLNVLYTHAPVNLRDPGPGQPIFNNLQTYVRLQARPSQLGDGDELARLMQRQFRDQLRGGFDLGFLDGVVILTHSSSIANLLLSGLSGGLTFVFGYHGNLGPGLESFCGVPIDHLWTGLPNTWSPPSLSFAAHQYRGSLCLMATFIPEQVPEALVKAFLDAVAEEMLST